MQLRKAATFLASTASFFLASNSEVAATSTSIRGVGEELEIGDDILTEEKPGTFLISRSNPAAIDYEDRSVHSGPEETFNIMVSDGSIYEIDDADDDLQLLQSGQTVTIPAGTVLRSKSGKVETNGAKIKIKASKGGKKDDVGDDGLKKKTKGLFERNLEGRNEEQQRNVDQLRRHLTSRSLGEKSVVAVRVQTTDAEYEFSEAFLRREVFGISGSTDEEDLFNLPSGYEQCSHGALTFTPLASATGTDGDDEVSIVDGVVTINVDVEANNNVGANVRNAVTQRITKVFGDMVTVADYWMYCLPPGTNGTWAAYAYSNFHLSVYNNDWCNYPSAQMHEIGHNLGFRHSGEWLVDGRFDKLNDQSGMMGYSYSGQDETPLMVREKTVCFNAVKSWQSGWYGVNGTHGDKTLELSSGDGCLVETLSGIADYDTTLNKVLIKIVNPSGNGTDLFVAFNAQKGINSGTREAGNQVTVVQAGTPLETSVSTLLGKLSAGGKYTTDSNFGEELTVEVVSISSSDSANVKIYFGSECT
eukprot:scaffold866_cov116-Skeletonema_dohrnii-CCMP3373.AAC.5